MCFNGVLPASPKLVRVRLSTKREGHQIRYLRGLINFNRLLPVSLHSVTVYMSLERERYLTRSLRGPINFDRLLPRSLDSIRVSSCPTSPCGTEIADMLSQETNQLGYAAAKVDQMYCQLFVRQDMEIADTLPQWSDHFERCRNRPGLFVREEVTIWLAELLSKPAHAKQSRLSSARTFLARISLQFCKDA
jgi:hypothetical protein